MPERNSPGARIYVYIFSKWLHTTSAEAVAKFLGLSAL